MLDKSQKSTGKTQANHLFKSSDFEIQVDQCLVTDDVRLAKLKVAASLPLLDIDISENRLIELVQLLVTLPLPKGDENIPSTVVIGDTTDSVSWQELNLILCEN